MAPGIQSPTSARGPGDGIARRPLPKKQAPDGGAVEAMEIPARMGKQAGQRQRDDFSARPEPVCGGGIEKERVGLKRVHPGKWEVYFGPWLAGELHDVDAGGIRAVVYRKKRSDKKASPPSASRLRYGSLRSPSLRARTRPQVLPPNYCRNALLPEFTERMLHQRTSWTGSPERSILT